MNEKEINTLAENGFNENNRIIKKLFLIPAIFSYACKIAIIIPKKKCKTNSIVKNFLVYIREKSNDGYIYRKKKSFT